MSSPEHWRSGEGIIRYDPRITHRGRELFDPWWVILVYDSELLNRLHRKWEHALGIKLSKPLWGAHVSVVRGEKPPLRAMWGSREGQSVTFQYSSVLRTARAAHLTRCYVWARCPELDAIREELGLPPFPAWNSYHMTVGTHAASLSRYISGDSHGHT